jgi:NOL1/NOP2/fmu family ribosome biogenesis protein
MINLKILNKKQIKEILALIKQQWNADIDLDYAFLKDKDDKIFIINKEFAELDLTKLRINNIGLYFAQKMIDGLRLSIEGSQIIGPKAKKNILELNKKQTKEWFQGNDIEVKTEMQNYVILKHESDFLGTGKIKENKILNYIPKARRLKTFI